jgi:sugar phosphate isomerase/epimerase
VTLPIGVQLYSVREQLAQDFDKTLETIAKAGYVGVEMAGLHGRTPQAVAQRLKDLNLAVSSMHTDVLTADGLKRSLDEAAALGTTKLVCPWRPPQTFDTEESISQLADQLNTAYQTLKQHGLSLLYHNHDFELRTVNGRYGLYALLEKLQPGIQIELDAYWVVVGGADAVGVIKHLDQRLGLLHVKDGAVNPAKPMLAVGDGKVDYGTIIPALPPSVPWLIVELDECATDMIEAVQKSVRYLVAKGLGHGR